MAGRMLPSRAAALAITSASLLARQSTREHGEPSDLVANMALASVQCAGAQVTIEESSVSGNGNAAASRTHSAAIALRGAVVGSYPTQAAVMIDLQSVTILGAEGSEQTSVTTARSSAW